RIGLPVPPGFTITTEVCTFFYAHKHTYPKELMAQVKAGIANTETILGKRFGDLEKPRNNPRFAWDCYRRFIQMYGDVVMGVQKKPGEDHEPFETVIENLK